MTKLGYDLVQLYEYSCKEMLFILKYRREGLAYEIWRSGTMTRAAQGKTFPTKLEEAIPELFEKQTVKIPKELREFYVKNIQEQLDKKYSPE